VSGDSEVIKNIPRGSKSAESIVGSIGKRHSWNPGGEWCRKKYPDADYYLQFGSYLW